MRKLIAAVLVGSIVGIPVGAPPNGTDASRIVGDNGLSGGLAVLVGSTDGEFECTLAAGGAWAVQGLAFSAQARDAAHSAIMNRGFYGLADGKQVASVSLGQNSRCNRFTASRNRLIGGLVTYFGKDFSHQRSTIARSQVLPEPSSPTI